MRMLPGKPAFLLNLYQALVMDVYGLPVTGDGKR
jgi:hypothetical protein